MIWGALREMLPKRPSFILPFPKLLKIANKSIYSPPKAQPVQFFSHISQRLGVTALTKINKLIFPGLATFLAFPRVSNWACLQPRTA
ncbi:protein of unknown function [Limnospira indica PCC 8005]|uniref:Uncharacterized protein n=1 Tax=Limnospira indica PCC 8005 TaxID=376219 RepID=A0A9P1P327_9CYAN|nr:protein of unknown function [Limnospira indica PCC 8005]